MRFGAALFLCVSLCSIGCGGGSSADGVVFEGTVTERGQGHLVSSVAGAKHSAGQTIGGVKVCVLSECSVTDDNGQWGVNVGNFTGGEVAIVLDGHGVSGSVGVDVPASARDVEIDLGHKGSALIIEEFLIDGEDQLVHATAH